MAWASDRNFQLTEGLAEGRALQFMIKMKEVLVATAGWVLLGNGDGVANSDWNAAGATDYFPTFPSITGADDGAWFAIESASGAHIVVQVPATTGDVNCWVSAGGGYTDDGVGHSTRVGASAPPSDEQQLHGTYATFGGTASQKMTIAYDDAAKSFIVFGRAGGFDNIRAFFLELLTDIKVGDPTPYVYSWQARGGSDEWERGDLVAPAANEVLGLHPEGAGREYAFGLMTFDGVNIMDVIGTDPVSGDEQTMDCWVGCQISGSYHLRGVADGIRHMSGVRSSGDKFAANRFIGIGAYAIDGWVSTDDLES